MPNGTSNEAVVLIRAIPMVKNVQYENKLWTGSGIIGGNQLRKRLPKNQAATSAQLAKRIVPTICNGLKFSMRGH